MENSVTKPAFLYHGSSAGLSGALTPRPSTGDTNGLFTDGPKDLVFATDDKQLAAVYSVKNSHMLSTGVQNGVHCCIISDRDAWKKEIDAANSGVYALPSASFTNIFDKENNKPSNEWTSTVAVTPDHSVKYTAQKVMEEGAQLFFLDKDIPKAVWQSDPSKGKDGTFMNRLNAKRDAGILPKDFHTFELASALIDAGLMQHGNVIDNIKPITLPRSPAAAAIKEDIEWLKQQMPAKQASAEFSLQSIPLDQLKLYPKEYQFRFGQAESGEVDTHKITGDKWDPLLHGAPIYVHKRKDKEGNWEYAVVDGHHRVNFAKRLAAEGKGPATLQAFVLEEEKGINTHTAKMMLAYKDIATKGSAAEAASVIREANTASDINKEFLPQLQMDKSHLSLAVKFSGLSDASLEKIHTGEVPEETAKYVVEHVQDKTRHDKVIELVGAKLKQDYPNYRPNTELAATLAPKANDNHRWRDLITKQRAEASYQLGV